MSGFTITVKPDEDDKPEGTPAAFKPGAEVRRETEPEIAAALANYTEIVPVDPTRATWVTMKFVNRTGALAPRITIESWAGAGQDVQNAPADETVTLNLLLGVGESYYVPNSAGCDLDRLVERSL